MAKVDPYLPPAALFDALYSMLEPDRVNQHLERGVNRGGGRGLHARPTSQ